MCDQVGPIKGERPGTPTVCNEVVVVQQLRTWSKRVPGKILEMVGGRRLVDIGLEKLKRACRDSGVRFVVAVCHDDVNAFLAAAISNVEVVPISREAAEAESWVGQCDPWVRSIGPPGTWILFSNVVCHPFIRHATICDMIRRATVAERPWISAYAIRGIAWDRNGGPLVQSVDALNTKTAPTILLPAHVGTAATIADCLEERRILGPDPEEFNLLLEERIDIDTYEDLRFARIVAAGIKSRTGSVP